MKDNNSICVCEECKKEINDDVSACPFCGCPISSKTDDRNSSINEKRKIVGIILCIVSAICIIVGISKITSDDYDFYIEHRNECQVNLDEVQDIADSSYGYFKSSYQDIADSYIDMIESDQKKIWKYRIEAIFFCGLGAVALIFGINKIKGE